MPHSPYFLYETINREPGLPQEPVLVIGPHVQADGTLMHLVLTPQFGPFPLALPVGMLTPTPFGFTWSVGNAPPAIYQLMMMPRFEEYWRPRLPGPMPAFATNEDLWRWFSERYGFGWPEQPAPPVAPPEPPAPPARDDGSPPGAPVAPPVVQQPAPPLAPPLGRWIELSLGQVPDGANSGESEPVVSADDFLPGLVARWDGDRPRLFGEAIAALSRGVAQWEAHQLASVLPLTLEQSGSGVSPHGWLSARLGTRDNPDATAQFAVVPVTGFPHGLVLAWPANEDGGPIFRRLAEELQRADAQFAASAPPAQPASYPMGHPSPLVGMRAEWIAFARSNRAAEDERLVAILAQGEEIGMPDTATLQALGETAAHARGTDGADATATAVLNWLRAAPSAARIAIVTPFFAAFTFAAADPAVTERVNTELAALGAGPAMQPSPSVPQIGAPPGQSPTGGIQVRQLPPSDDPNIPARGAPPAPPQAPPGAPPVPMAAPSAASQTMPPPPPAPAAPPALLLVIEDGGVAGQRIPLTERLTIGRHASSRIVLPDLEVSRSHAVIEPDALGEVTITDNGSANGTWINGERVTRHVLRPGDRLVLGQTNLRIIENA
jgi:hypothetical protein